MDLEDSYDDDFQKCLVNKRVEQSKFSKIFGVVVQLKPTNAVCVSAGLEHPARRHALIAAV